MLLMVIVERSGALACRDNHGGWGDGSPVRQAAVDRANAGR